MSSNIIFTLKDILLNEEGNHTLDDLKKDLGVTSDKTIVNELLRLLKGEVESITFDTMTYDKSISIVIYGYLYTFFTESRQCDRESVILRLNVIASFINSQLLECNNELKKNKNWHATFEREFWETISQLNAGIIKLAKIREKQADNYNCSLLEDMIYNLKNLPMLQEVSKKCPKLFLECKKDGESLFMDYIKNYIEIIKDEKTKISDIIYYDTVIGIFLKNKNLKIDKKAKDLISIAIEQVRRNKNIDKENRNQRLIFLTHLRKKLAGEDKYVESIEELDNKYKSNIIISSESRVDLETYFNSCSHEYHDFTNKDVITIDKNNSVDLDDGISLEKLDNDNYLLGIYIADVSAHIPFISKDDLIALHRGATVYDNATQVLPMLPGDLSLNSCSLLSNNIRETVVYYFEIDPDGNIKNHYYTKGLVKVKPDFHLSYDRADKILEHGCDNANLKASLLSLQQLSDKGIFKKMFTDELGNNERSTAHIMNDKFMVLANYMAAKDAKEAGLPFLYRNYQKIVANVIIEQNPSLNILIDNIDKKSTGIVKSMVDRYFSRPYYSTQALPHDGLGLDVYAHTTSPIRRYADLANQRLITSLFIDKLRDNKFIYQIEDVLKQIATELNENQLVANQYVSDYAHILRR